MTEQWLTEIEALCQAATPGPWEYDGQHNEITTPSKDSPYWLVLSESRSAPDQEFPVDDFGHHFDANFAFIAAARTAIPRLIAEVRRLRAENERGRRFVETAIGSEDDADLCP